MPGNIPGVEPWTLRSQSNLAIGDLGLTWFLVDFFASETFTIPASLFPTFPAANWTLALQLTEASGGNDSIKLDWAKLSVTYNDVPVASTPEPATLTLLGTGIAAGLWRRRRQNRQTA
jgi:hypothetical protein